MFSKMFYFLITSAVFASPISVFAAVEANITGSSPVPVPEWATGGFLNFLGWLFPVMIAGAALIATLSIIFAGFQWMAGAISPPQVEAAKNRISAAVLGLAIALGSWLILNTINPAFIQLEPPVGFTLQCPGGVCPSWTDVLFGPPPPAWNPNTKPVGELGGTGLDLRGSPGGETQTSAIRSFE